MRKRATRGQSRRRRRILAAHPGRATRASPPPLGGASSEAPACRKGRVAKRRGDGRVGRERRRAASPTATAAPSFSPCCPRCCGEVVAAPSCARSPRRWVGASDRAGGGGRDSATPPRPPPSCTHSYPQAHARAATSAAAVATLEDESLPPPRFIVGDAKPPPPLLTLEAAIAAVKVGGEKGGREARAGGRRRARSRVLRSSPSPHSRPRRRLLNLPNSIKRLRPRSGWAPTRAAATTRCGARSPSPTAPGRRRASPCLPMAWTRTRRGRQVG